MLQTHNEIVFFFSFVRSSLEFFVFVSAFFSFCFFFFFCSFWFLFNYRKGVVNFNTHSRMWECTQSNIVFFYGKYDVTVMTILKRMFKGQKPEFWRKYRTVLF